jgi:hypothetical protein
METERLIIDQIKETDNPLELVVSISLRITDFLLDPDSLSR